MGNNYDSLMNSVSEAIISEILNGKIKVGTFLNSKRQLAIKYNVSRTVIDRVIENLINHGYIMVNENNKLEVISTDRFNNFQNMINFSKYNDQVFDQKEMKDLLYLKFGLDLLSIRLIPLPLKDESYLKLKNILSLIKINCSYCKHNSCFRCSTHVYDFYSELASLSNNCFLSMLYQSFRKTNVKLIADFIKAEGVKITYEKASILLELLRNNNRMEALKLIDSRFKT